LARRMVLGGGPTVFQTTTPAKPRRGIVAPPSPNPRRDCGWIAATLDSPNAVRVAAIAPGTAPDVSTGSTHRTIKPMISRWRGAPQCTSPIEALIFFAAIIMASPKATAMPPQIAKEPTG
jgi:hypothetical protein